MSFGSLRAVAGALQAAGIRFALGGSGLLCALGLAEANRDWDLTTDCALDEVTEALIGLDWRPAPHGDPPFASAYRLAVRPGGGPEIDLMGQFAIVTAEGTVRLPTIPCGEWQGVPVGSAEVWAVAYRLMGRDAKADLLSRYLARGGGRAEIVRFLLAQPLPAGVRAEVESWPS